MTWRACPTQCAAPPPSASAVITATTWRVSCGIQAYIPALFVVPRTSVTALLHCLACVCAAGIVSLLLDKDPRRRPSAREFLSLPAVANRMHMAPADEESAWAGAFTAWVLPLYFSNVVYGVSMLEQRAAALKQCH